MTAKYVMPVSFTREQLTEGGYPMADQMLQTFQDAASAHAEEAGVGFDALISKGLIWVVTKIKYRVHRPLIPSEALTLTTYPIPVGSLLYQRDFYIDSPSGERVVTASSQWCVADCRTRRAVQTAVDFPGEYTDKRAFPKGIERIRPGQLPLVGSHIISKEDLDKNDHTNNCRYAHMAQAALGEDIDIVEFNINFSKETRLGDEVLLSAGDGIVVGKLADGTQVFVGRVGA